jgi:hypothetical protein
MSYCRILNGLFASKNIGIQEWKKIEKKCLFKMFKKSGLRDKKPFLEKLNRFLKQALI